VALCGSIVAVSVIGWLAAGGGTDPDLAKVRALLKENLPTGKFEEIQWWPTRTVPKNVGYWSGHRVCKLKFRTQNSAGGMEVVEQVFTVDNDGVRAIGTFVEQRRDWFTTE